MRISRGMCIGVLAFSALGGIQMAQAKTYMMPKIVSSKWLAPDNGIISYNLEFTATASALSWTPSAALEKEKIRLWLIQCRDYDAANKVCTNNLPEFNVNCQVGAYATCVKEFNGLVSGTHQVKVSAYGSNLSTCLMILATPITGSTSLSEYISGDCRPGIDIPEPPPVVDWCGIGTQSIMIDFGTMTSAEAPGKSKSENFSVTCEGSPRYMYKLQTGTAINLSNGMTASLTVDGFPLGTMMTGTAGNTSHTVMATLAGTPNTAGAFSGTGVLMATYQ